MNFKNFIDSAKGFFLVVLLLCLFLTLSAEGGTFAVQGIGYPPIKAENSAHARLMARRAAVIDAYRNALKGDNLNEGFNSGDFYTGLSGFVRGARIVKEEYLSDGGVVVTMEISEDSIYRVDSRYTQKEERYGSEGSPERVSLDEWYKAIEPYVIYDPNSQN